MEYANREGDAPFNMAVATLMRLDTILQQIRTIDFLFQSDSPDKQKAHIGLVKQFYINAIPLLADAEVTDYKDRVLKIELKSTSRVKAGNQSMRYYYDKDIEMELNTILIELQQKLKKYFMPKAKDPSRAVAGFE
jgi:hypothetical protein